MCVLKTAAEHELRVLSHTCFEYQRIICPDKHKILIFSVKEWIKAIIG